MQAPRIRLLVLTGCRKSEFLSLKWSHVDSNMGYRMDIQTGLRRQTATSLLHFHQKRQRAFQLAVQKSFMLGKLAHLSWVSV